MAGLSLPSPSRTLSFIEKQGLFGYMVTLLIYLLTVLAGRNLITTLSKISTSDTLEIIIALLVL